MVDEEDNRRECQGKAHDPKKDPPDALSNPFSSQCVVESDLGPVLGLRVEILGSRASLRAISAPFLVDSRQLVLGVECSGTFGNHFVVQRYFGPCSGFSGLLWSFLRVWKILNIAQGEAGRGYLCPSPKSWYYLGGG